MTATFLFTKHRPQLERTVRWSIPVNNGGTVGVVPDMPAGTGGREDFGLPPRTPFMFRPSRVLLRYLLDGDADPVLTVTVSGSKVKKDGTCGYGNGGTTYTLPAPEMPQWLAELIADEATTRIDVT